MVAPNHNSTRTLIDEYLAAQQRLQTPVARFSQTHDNPPDPAMAPVYRDLIPLSKPGPGEQYAFEVDLDACTGCKACVAGCHSLNGLDHEETWRDVGLLVGGTRSHPFQQTVTTACHHCADPGCLNGCPVLAYEKDPLTGIVRHLDDQCIGCQYCVLKCPYDVPKYNERLGIVRKCDMCHHRLAHDEAPACVQACPTHAIKIVTVTTHVDGNLVLDTSDFLRGAPSPEYTWPTTRFVSNRSIPPEIIAADAASLRPQHPHWPLVFMLTLMPLAVGCFLSAAFSPAGATPLTLLGWLAGAAGLFASVFHLGQPLRAWRIFLGWRRSWLSREAILFGLWFGLASTTLLSALPTAFPALPVPALIAGPLANLEAHRQVFITASAALGVVALVCSCMIYVDTHRDLWRASQTFPRFLGAAIALGAAAHFAIAPTTLHLLPLTAALLFKLAVELRVLRPLDSDDDTPTAPLKTARLLTGYFRTVHGMRVALPLAALFIGALLVSNFPRQPFLARFVFAMIATGELAERYLYFRAVVAPKMPGVIS